MKIFYYTFILILVLPLAVAESYTSPLSPAPGTAGNPIYINGNIQIVTSNEEREDDLIQQYGYSEYQSCRASYCGTTGGNPSLEAQCLAQVESMFQSGFCGRTAPSLQCDYGYTLVNGSCVRTNNAVPSACPSGTRLIGTACMPFNCSEGYVPQGSSCVALQAETETSADSGPTYEDLSNQINALTEQIDAYAINNASQESSIETPVREIAPRETDVNNVCVEQFGENGVILSVNENNIPTCGCVEGYTIGRDGKCSEVAKVIATTSINNALDEDSASSKDANREASPVTYIAVVALLGILANGVRLYLKMRTV